MSRNTFKAMTIAKKDLKSYFNTPTAYILIAAFMLIIGWMFYSILEYFARSLQESQFPAGRNPTLMDGVIRPLFGNINVILMMMTPFITMRLFAEEKKNQTLSLLLTSPISLPGLIFGKFLSALFLVMIMLGTTLVFPLILHLVDGLDLGAVSASYLGTLLMAMCYLALGVFFSSVTENQIVAVILSFSSILFFWIISWAASSASGVTGQVLNYLSLVGHYSNFSQGAIHTSDLIYYFSFSFLALFLTHRVLDSYRWR